MSQMVPSVVAVAEDVDEHESGTNGLKRRQSDALEQEAEQDNKRQRTSPGKRSPTAANGGEHEIPINDKLDTAPVTAQKEEAQGTQRKGRVGDEKQRSKRLFGALLGNLNQPSDRVSKRRLDIEQRRKAELQKQDDERLEDRQRRLEKLAAQRRREQINVDEQNMLARHKSVLDTANFLHTRTEPILHFRPWELLPDEEDRIDDQIKASQAQVDEELSNWEKEKQKRMNEVDEQSTNGADKEALDTAAADIVLTDPETAENNVAKQEPAEPLAAPVEADKDEDVDPQIAVDTDNSLKRAVVPESEHSTAESPTAAQPELPTTTTTKDEAHDIAVEPKEAETKIDVENEVKDDAEDDGDHVVEGDEDTVIY